MEYENKEDGCKCAKIFLKIIAFGTDLDEVILSILHQFILCELQASVLNKEQKSLFF